MTTSTRLYDSAEDAVAAVQRLKRLGIDESDISIVGRHDRLKISRSGDDAETGAEVGGVAGAAVGLLAGLGVLAIPGVGPVVAAGWLASTAAGAVAGAAAGAATGGIIGTLTDSGLSEEDAHVYAEGIRRGGYVVAVRTSNYGSAEIDRVLDGDQSVDIPARRQEYRGTGWSRFDPTLPPYLPPVP